MDELRCLVYEGFAEMNQWFPDRRKLQNTQYELQLPLFDGKNPREWVCEIESYFQLFWFSPEEEFMAACVALVGEAFQWFKQELLQRPLRQWRWQDLKLLLVLRFGSSPSSFLEHPTQMRFSDGSISAARTRNLEERQGCFTENGDRGGACAGSGGAKVRIQGKASGLQRKVANDMNRGSDGEKEFGGKFTVREEDLGGNMRAAYCGGGDGRLSGKEGARKPARREEREDEGRVVGYSPGGGAGGHTSDMVEDSTTEDEDEVKIILEDEGSKRSLTEIVGLQGKLSLESPSKGILVNYHDGGFSAKISECHSREYEYALSYLATERGELKQSFSYMFGLPHTRPVSISSALISNFQTSQPKYQPNLFPSDSSNPNDYHAHSQPNPPTKVLKLHSMAPPCNFFTQPKAIRGLINEDLERQWKPGISLRNNNLKGYQGKYLGTEYYPP